ncbi:MAG: DNA (cytosine-5-)-methyltransferase [Candidatus Wallbacteria bacterium]|nr:DNA (cytosine-5-)-methyltransferase [Candidatus Wallbacteria bacterium]
MLKRTRLKAVSLFSGCGGLDLGFVGDFVFRGKRYHRNKFDLMYSGDFDTDAVSVYNANSSLFRGHTCSLQDVRDITDKDVPDFDVLLAGFPCQPFSNAGKREGVNDKRGRGTLFYECERFFKSKKGLSLKSRPLAFVFENVRGILSSKLDDGTTVPDEIASRMKRLGYNTKCKLIKTSDYGVPQNRYRAIFVGIREDLPPFDFGILDEIAHEAGFNTNSFRPYELLLGSILADIPPDAKQADDVWAYSPASQTMIEKIGPCLDGKEALDKFKESIPLCEISNTIEQGKSWKNIPFEEMSLRFQKIYSNPKKYRAPNFYRRFALGEICGTITASGQPENSGITHPFENRRFSVREIARIQSFPDDFVFPVMYIPNAYKVIGNAVPPIFGWVLARSLSRHLGAYA